MEFILIIPPKEFEYKLEFQLKLIYNIYMLLLQHANHCICNI